MRKNKKIIIGAISIVFVIILIILGLFSFTFNHYYQKMNIINEPETIMDVDEAVVETVSSDDVQEIEAISKLDETILNLEKCKKEIPFNNNIFNVLLIGSDTRDVEFDRGRSDSMILLSLNKNQKTIYITSFMRDMYVNIPNKGNNRLNAAYAYGGADLLIDTIQENFQVNIDRYVQVDFDTFIDVVDFCGGVDNISLSEQEIQILNSYMSEVNLLNELPIENGYITDLNKDVYSLNGYQALAYSRIRYVNYGNEYNDFGRTARQRTIMLAIFEKVKQLDVLELKNLMDNVLPNITTNIEKGELISLLLEFNRYSKYEVISSRIPIDSSYDSVFINGMAVLGVDFEKNIDYLHSTLYENNESAN